MSFIRDSFLFPPARACASLDALSEHRRPAAQEPEDFQAWAHLVNPWIPKGERKLDSQLQGPTSSCYLTWSFYSPLCDNFYCLHTCLHICVSVLGLDGVQGDADFIAALFTLKRFLARN